MEETLTPDIVISNTKYTAGQKTYSFYCKRKTRAEAKTIQEDLIANHHEAIIRVLPTNGQNYYTIWWKKQD